MFCTRIEWALKLKGLEDEMIVEDWSKGEERIALEVEPSAQEGPGDFGRWRRVAGSKVILEYIDEKWKGGDLFPLLRQDPFKFVSGLSLLMEKRVLGAWGARCAECGLGKEKAGEAALECSKYPEKQIEGKKFFAGEKIGYLDPALARCHGRSWRHEYT
ncbi:hypothetical protein NL676_022225 [Syzygium grande]|nr:hypothetical protein NL676_022225 [Syzygium grande]